jgi:hypothetical protein
MVCSRGADLGIRGSRKLELAARPGGSAGVSTRASSTRSLPSVNCTRALASSRAMMRPRPNFAWETQVSGSAGRVRGGSPSSSSLAASAAAATASRCARFGRSAATSAAIAGSSSRSGGWRSAIPASNAALADSAARVLGPTSSPNEPLIPPSPVSNDEAIAMWPSMTASSRTWPIHSSRSLRPRRGRAPRGRSRHAHPSGSGCSVGGSTGTSSPMRRCIAAIQSPNSVIVSVAIPGAAATASI